MAKTTQADAVEQAKKVSLESGLNPNDKPEMVDPIIYRADYDSSNIINGYDPKKLKNANMNISQYWDDSSSEYADSQYWWWENEKYTGENTKNSKVSYNPNATLEWLDPNYKYWQDAEMANSQEANYIAKRNDEIASALYNAWKTSMEDVWNFLNQQDWFRNSYETARQNTLLSIWKRIWEYGEQNWWEEKADTSRIESDLNKSTSSTIYWKDTAQEWDPTKGIKTNEDVNSPFKIMDEARIANLKTLLGMPPQQMAAAIYSDAIPWDMQAVVDYKTYYPELYAQVQEYLKQFQWQDTVNAITTWWDIPTNTDGTSSANNSIAEFAADNAGYSNSMQDILKDIHQTLESNKSASSASATMDSIEADMATLNRRLKNLNKEANNLFKWDVPDYIVKAYINNRRQEIQDQLAILSDRYKYASNRYDKEVANAQWEKEYQIKKDQLQIQKDELALKDYQIKNWISTTKNKGNDSSTTNPWDKFQVTTKSDAEVADAVDLLYSMFDNWQLGKAQCWVWIQRYYLPMLWISISGISSLEWKKSLINEWEWYIPKKWDLIIINSGAKLEDWTPAWHIGIVLEVHKDWTVEYMDWNGNSDEKPSINGININSKSLLWFRNVNKWQWESSWWTDQDYANFEMLLDPKTNQTTVKAIASKYWYEDNIPALTKLAKDAINSRPQEEWQEEKSTSDDLWYDEELWYNPVDSKFYQMYFNNRLYTIESLAKDTWTTEEEARRRAVNWKNNLWDSVSEKITDWLNDAQKALLKKVVEWDMKPTEELAETLWFWGDLTLLWDAMNEVAKDEWQVEIDNALRTLAELQIVFEDEGFLKNWEYDRSIWWATVPWSNRKLKFNQLKAQLKLDKVRNSRKQWVTYGSMTEAEWEMLEKAISSLSMRWMNDEEFTNEIKNITAYLWSASYWDPNNKWVIQWPTASEWNNYVKQVRNSATFDIYSTISEDNSDRREAFDEASKWAGNDDANDWIIDN